jgi:transposase
VWPIALLCHRLSGAQTHHFLYVAPGRTSLAIEQFAQALIARRDNPKRIEWVAMDTLHFYVKGVREQFPAAQLVYERYHLMVMAGRRLTR